MAPFPGLRLPPELIDLIIDHLHDDKESLRACGLVCKTWIRCARFHLFRKLRVHGLDVGRFSESASAVIPFVRRLHLAELQWDEILGIWPLSVTDLPAKGLDSYALSTPSRNFSSAVDVRLDDVQFPTTGELFRLICAFPCLQRLAVHCRPFDDPKPNLPTQTTFSLSPHLRVLELNRICMDQVLDWFLSLPDRPTLRAVGLHPYQGNNFDTIARLLSALDNSLESLLVSTSVAHPESDWPLDLRPNTCLRSLQIEFDHGDDANLVKQILSQISSPHIEELGLEIRTGEDDEVGHFRWGEIAAALQGADWFSGLKTVDVRVVQLVSDNLVPPAVEWVVNHMPLCNSRGILRVCDTDAQCSYFLRR